LFELALELGISDGVVDHDQLASTKPSPWAEMKKAGKVTLQDKDTARQITRRRRDIWLSWNPDKNAPKDDSK
jgi:hypothetical protein